MPLSAEDKRLVIACIEGIDVHLENTPATVRMRGELAAAVLAMAASSAYDSAVDQGHPEEAEDRYEAFVHLVVLRARELFEIHR